MAGHSVTYGDGSGGVIAKMLFNTYGMINGTRSYLPRALFEVTATIVP
jgi:hypothetical protein